VIEMSQSKWLVAALVPGVERHPLKKFDAQEEDLLKLLHRWRNEAGQAGREIKRTGCNPNTFALELVPVPDAAAAAETPATSAAEASVTRLRLFIAISVRMLAPLGNASALSAVSIKIVHIRLKSPDRNRAAFGVIRRTAPLSA
jgi:hypothetical protein